MPKEQNGFYVVLDGLCSKLGFGRVGKDVVIHYGGERKSVYNTTERSGLASFIALRESGLESIGDPMIASPTGIAGASLEDFWIADSTGSRSSEGAVLHRRSGTTWKTYARDQTNLHSWVDGGIIGTAGMGGGGLWIEGSTTTPPPQLASDMMPGYSFTAFPTGEIIIIGLLSSHTSGDPLIARTWSPAAGKGAMSVKHHNLSLLGDGWPQIVEVGPSELYVSVGPRMARWDGSKWRLIGVAKEKIKTAMRAAAPDEVWVTLESGAVQKSTPGAPAPTSFTTIKTPEAVASLDGPQHGTPWIVGQSGKLYKREAIGGGDGETWKAMPLPTPAFTAGSAPAFKAKNILVNAPDDVVVIAMYWEKGLGWMEQELHQTLLRTKSPKETLRCNEPDPENNNINIGRGFQSWPPLVTAANASSCTTPFAVLGRKSNALKTPPHDWPKIRAALKGHGAEIGVESGGHVQLVELVSGDRTFVGTKAKDFTSAKRIAELAASKDRLRPEIVCGEPPEVARTITVDPSTGNAVR